MKSILSLALIISVLTSCKPNSGAPDSDQLVMATLWYQHAAETKALYYQAYNLAELRVRQALDSLPADVAKAVITDIDETVLDNSPSEGKNILEGKSYSPERWKDWTEKRRAQALPGSLKFANFLQSVGVELYYISNRSIDETEATLDNLRTLGFPFADEEHLLLKSSGSDKTSRRDQVAESHLILLLLGDNLADFSNEFDDRSLDQGTSTVQKRADEFGNRFIVFPNPLYGSWTTPLYGSTSGLDPAEIATKRRNLVISY